MGRLTASIAFAAALLLSATAAQARIPLDWPFLDFNEAVETSKREKKPLFVYFGFPTCPHCAAVNEHTFTSEPMRKRYTANYVLGYFDVRGNPDDVVTLPGGGETTRAEAIKRYRASAVPAWMFVDPEGKTILMRRGSRTRVDSFMTYDLYVGTGAYRRMTFEEFLSRRGLQDDGEK